MSMKDILHASLLLSGMMPRGTESIRIVNDASYDELINEHKLILEKKSKLSRRQRDAVEYRYASLVKRGKIVE